MEINVYYQITEKAQKKAILAEKNSSKLQHVTVECSEKLLEKAYVNPDGVIIGLCVGDMLSSQKDKIGFPQNYRGLSQLALSRPSSFNESMELTQFPEIISTNFGMRIKPDSPRQLEFYREDISFDEIKSPEDMFAFITSLLAENKDLEAKVNKANEKAKKLFVEKANLLKPELKKKIEEEERMKERAEKEREEMKEEKEQRENALEESMLDWIQKFGSERLKLAHEVDLAGSCRSIYHEERIEHELGSDWKKVRNNDIYYDAKELDVINPPMEILQLYKASLDNGLIQDVELNFGSTLDEGDKFYVITALHKTTNTIVIQVVLYE